MLQGHVKEIHRVFNFISFLVALLSRSDGKYFYFNCKTPPKFERIKSLKSLHGHPSKFSIMLFSLLVKALKFRALTRLLCASTVVSEATRQNYNPTFCYIHLQKIYIKIIIKKSGARKAGTHVCRLMFLSWDIFCPCFGRSALSQCKHLVRN